MPYIYVHICLNDNFVDAGNYHHFPLGCVLSQSIKKHLLAAKK